MKQEVYLYRCIGQYGMELTSLINDHDLYDISKKECIKSLVLQTTRLYHYLLSHEAHRCPCLILEELYNCDKLKAPFFWLVYKREIAESVADTHYVVNRVAHLIVAESYYMVFIEGILLQGHSSIGTKKHDVPRRCWYIMGKFYIRSRWLLAITSQPWSKRHSKFHLNMPILKANNEEIQEIWVLVAKASKKVVVMNSWLKASKGTIIVSSWQKPTMGATLNQTHKGAMIASLWKESAEKL